MAFSVGDIVVTIPAVAQLQGAFAAGGLPLAGTVESDGGGNCVVCWANGTRTTVTADGANSLLKLRAVSAGALAFYHKRVKIDPATGIGSTPADAVGQESSEGLVIAVFTTDSGPTDFAVVEFTGGDIWVLQTNSLILL
jgi:hypothetical protein